MCTSIKFTSYGLNAQEVPLNTEAKKQIRNILTLLLAGVLCGGLIAGYMIYRYGPSGKFIAGNIILAPETLDKINFADPDSKGRGKTRLVFDGAQFSFFEKNIGKVQKFPVTMENYEQFYNRVKPLVSLEKVEDKVKRLFDSHEIAILSITMRPEYSYKDQTAVKLFQVIQFIESEYFRVQVPGAGGLDEWAYYYEPGLYPQLFNLFVTDDTKK